MFDYFYNIISDVRFLYFMVTITIVNAILAVFFSWKERKKYRKMLSKLENMRGMIEYSKDIEDPNLKASELPNSEINRKDQ